MTGGLARGAEFTIGFGVLNAPVDFFCNLSNSSCSFGGRRGGAGPVANAVRQEVKVKKRREGRRNVGGKSLDIVGDVGRSEVLQWVMI